MARFKAWSRILRGGGFLILVTIGIPLLLTDALRTVLITGTPWVA